MNEIAGKEAVTLLKTEHESALVLLCGKIDLLCNKAEPRRNGAHFNPERSAYRVRKPGADEGFNNEGIIGQLSAFAPHGQNIVNQKAADLVPGKGTIFSAL